ncbi:MAG: Uncharacterized protein FD152_4693 [Xanthobacteraceae bacterium]|nr:MAG: Uncharacterized protein FD152_4693 [Xanthobacteraceae bacterium]
MSAQYSAGPKARATLIISGASRMRPNSATVPAKNEPMAATKSAAPARPCFAISCPSRQVTTDAASPGMRTRMEVVEPPYIEP